MKKFLWAIIGIVGVAILLLGLTFVIPGYDMYIVRSDSMQPVFAAGDIIVTAPPQSPPFGEIKVGTVVTFNRGSETITHRIIGINGELLTTKGDANEDPEPQPIDIEHGTGSLSV